MKRIIPVAALGLFAVAGCQNKQAASSAALQPAPAPMQVQAAPAPVEPSAAIDTQTPTPMTDISTSTPGASASASGGNYTVKAGDTLYRIAINHYGDGKQWKKIAAANPGLTPTKLRVGQTIVLP